MASTEMESNLIAFNAGPFADAHPLGRSGEERQTRRARDDKKERELHGPNENKMSEGWREGASLRVEGGI